MSPRGGSLLQRRELLCHRDSRHEQAGAFHGFLGVENLRLQDSPVDISHSQGGILMCSECLPRLPFFLKTRYMKRSPQTLSCAADERISHTTLKISLVRIPSTLGEVQPAEKAMPHTVFCCVGHYRLREPRPVVILRSTVLSFESATLTRKGFTSRATSSGTLDHKKELELTITNMGSEFMPTLSARVLAGQGPYVSFSILRSCCYLSLVFHSFSIITC